MTSIRYAAMAGALMALAWQGAGAQTPPPSATPAQGQSEQEPPAGGNRGNEATNEVPAAPGGTAAPTGTATEGGATAQESAGQQAPATTQRQPAGQDAGQGGGPVGKADTGNAAGGKAPQAVAAPPPPAADPQLLDQMAGTEAVTIDGKKVGEFAKVVQKAGGVYGAVIETGGFLGIGETRRVVPLDKILIQNEQIVVNMASAELDTMPILETGQWGNFKK
jgi:hypothetical protein